jgi:hypothetical protein
MMRERTEDHSAVAYTAHRQYSRYQSISSASLTSRSLSRANGLKHALSTCGEFLRFRSRVYRFYRRHVRQRTFKRESCAYGEECDNGNSIVESRR